MARPRIFISSTYYDLKHIRASLDLFVDSLGFEPVLSEKGDIAYTSDRPLDESCYREVENSDVLVLIVGGRYGSEASSSDQKKPSNTFFDRYESITKKEYEAAMTKDIPVYILIERGVHSEYQTFQRNKDKTDINYAHVQSVNVFLLIEDILLRPRNNPVQTFEKFEEIENWLREQWAGLFRELLRRQSQQQQLVGLSTQVTELKNTNETLKKYLEAVMTGADRTEKNKLIREEEKRLEESKRIEQLRLNGFIQHLARAYDVGFEPALQILQDATDLESLLAGIQAAAGMPRPPDKLYDIIARSEGPRRDLDRARDLVGRGPFDYKTDLALQGRDVQERASMPRAIPVPRSIEALHVVKARPSAGIPSGVRISKTASSKTDEMPVRTRAAPEKKTSAAKKVLSAKRTSLSKKAPTAKKAPAKRAVSAK